MLNRFTLSCSLLLLSLFALAQPKIKLDTFSRSYASPVDIANDGFTSRMFVVQQNGIIWTLDSNGVKLDTFIDLRTKVNFAGEEGLLGMTFHPDYQNNGYFYTYYTKKNSTDNNVVRYKVTSNPNRATKDSERVVITFSHPTFTNHNGGCIKFGNDGYLYIAVGDGGSSNDPNGNGQNKNTFLGKLLRIDVNNFSGTYSVPATNPFVGQSNVKTEIWAYGLRNPWRFSFDRQTKDLWIGDVGQGAREEVDFQASNSIGGENYGWRCYEGNKSNILTGCAGIANYKFPIYEYDHSSSGGVAITGGFVYRGNKYSDFNGYYICGDYGSANFWLIKKEDTSFRTTPIGKPLPNISISSFGEDIRGEMYAVNVGNGVIYKIRELCSPFKISLVQKNNPLCFNSSDGQIQMTSVGSNGVVNYVWSNNTSGNTISNLNAGKYVVTATDAIGCVRKDSFVLVKPDTLKINLLNKVNPSCPSVANGLLQVQGVGGNSVYSYNWNNGSLSALNSNLANGNYVVTLKDSNNCMTKDSFVLVNLDTLDKPIITQSNDTLYTQTGFTYQWKLNNNNIISANQSFYKILINGKYQVEITDINGCKAISDTLLLFLITSTKNISSAVEKFSLFPNPTNNQLNIDIDFKTKQSASLKIINSIGQIVYDEKIEGNKISKLISVQTLPKGLYQLSIFMQDGKVSSQSFIKE